MAADIDQSAATIHVGERLQFTARDSDTVNFDIEPADLHSITWYGSELTFVGIKPGRTTLTIPNFDKHFHCPSGPCAHPNLPLSLTVTVLAAEPGESGVPAIPVPMVLSTAGDSRTLHLRVGQQLDLPPGLNVTTYSSTDVGRTLDGVLCRWANNTESITTMVAARPGTQMISLDSESTHSPPTATDLTVIINS